MEILNIDALPELQLAPGIMARVITAQNLTITHVTLEAGALLPLHSHANEQVVNVLEGHLELTVDGRVADLHSGTALVLPSNIPHSGRAVTKCFVIDVFYPVREDFRAAAEKAGLKRQ